MCHSSVSLCPPIAVHAAQDACQLDAVITLVDAMHITQHLNEEKPEGVINEAIQQVAFADKLLLNKVRQGKSMHQR